MQQSTNTRMKAEKQRVNSWFLQQPRHTICHSNYFVAIAYLCILKGFNAAAKILEERELIVPIWRIGPTVPVVTVVIACTLYYTFIRRTQFFVYLCYQWDADKMKYSPLGWACRRVKHIIKTHSGSFRLMNVSYNHQHATSSCGKTRTATTAADRST